MVLGIAARCLCGGTAEGLIEACREALAGGLPALMLREKDLSAAELFPIAMELRRLTADAGALLIVNDRPDVALAVYADGIHVGRTSLPPSVVRRLCPAPMLLGASCHSAQELRGAAEAGADYALLSPVYAPTSKETDLALLGEEGFLRLAGAARIPVLALGGITPERANELMRHGAAGVGVMGGIFGAPDRAAAVRAFSAAVAPAGGRIPALLRRRAESRSEPGCSSTPE